MRVIKELAHYIEDEACGALEYAISALNEKRSDQELASLYRELAEVERGHADRLHEMVVKYIRQAEDAGMQPTKRMKDRWDDAHDALIAKTEEADIYIRMFDRMS